MVNIVSLIYLNHPNDLLILLPLIRLILKLICVHKCLTPSIFSTDYFYQGLLLYNTMEFKKLIARTNYVILLLIKTFLQIFISLSCGVRGYSSPGSAIIKMAFSGILSITDKVSSLHIFVFNFKFLCHYLVSFSKFSANFLTCFSKVFNQFFI